MEAEDHWELNTEMRILVSGSSGLIGSALVEKLAYKGYDVLRLVRQKSPRRVNQVLWDPTSGQIEHAPLEGLDAVVHLAGENIAGRWNHQKKERIRNSRVHGTEFLCNSLQGLARPPKVLLCASATGYYGDQGDEVLTESSAAGTDFLAGVCREWEGATKIAAAQGIRVVNLRFGHVLSSKGGLLKKMLPPFKLGFGGMLGDGRQFMSWIAIDDVVGVAQFVLTHSDFLGPVNVVSPNPVTNYEFTKTLGRVLRRPTVLRVPRFVLRAIYGELGDVMLSSARVLPERLAREGCGFKFPQLEGALRHVLGKEKR